MAYKELRDSGLSDSEALKELGKPREVLVVTEDMVLRGSALRRLRYQLRVEDRDRWGELC